MEEYVSEIAFIAYIHIYKANTAERARRSDALHACVVHALDTRVDVFVCMYAQPPAKW